MKIQGRIIYWRKHLTIGCPAEDGKTGKEYHCQKLERSEYFLVSLRKH